MRNVVLVKAVVISAAVALMVGFVATAVADDSGFFRTRPSISGPLANATITFGAWQTDPPLDRFPNASPPARNQHDVLPFQSFVKKGGAINFIVGGGHQIAIYGNNTKPSDIDVNNTVLSTGVPNTLALIADPTNRVYRGPDPTLLGRDRTETVHFPNAGSYLVICAVRPHFVDDGMYGVIRVLP
jgi:hypothetical protein